MRRFLNNIDWGSSVQNHISHSMVMRISESKASRLSVVVEITMHLLGANLLLMALPPDAALALQGPARSGRGVQGLYVYRICMQRPSDKAGARTNVKTPADFDRETFHKCTSSGQLGTVCRSVCADPQQPAQ